MENFLMIPRQMVNPELNVYEIIIIIIISDVW
jgi:hypothetical protein